MLHLFEFQKEMKLKIAPKLREKDVSPKHFDTMNVGSALRLISFEVAAALRILVDKYGQDEQLLVTAWLIEKMRKWFDLMTSRHPKLALSLRNEEKRRMKKMPALKTMLILSSFQLH